MLVKILTIQKMDPTYVPQSIETRQVYGVSLRQNRNDAKIDAKLFDNIVTTEKSVSSKCIMARWLTTVYLALSYPNQLSQTLL